MRRELGLLIFSLLFLALLFSNVSAAECKDSDGLANPELARYIKGLCESSTIQEYDTCSGSTLHELRCASNECIEKLYNCPNGCEDGACIIPEDLYCTDSNNGKFARIKGTCTDWTGADYTDECTDAGGGVWDHMCLPTYGGHENVCTRQFTRCSSGVSTCQDGICVLVDNPNPYYECEEDDGGLNYYKRGTTIMQDTHEPYTWTDPDRCQNEISTGYPPDPLWDSFLWEHWCEGGERKRTGYNCPTDCKDGACISEGKPDLIITDATNIPENVKLGEKVSPVVHYKNIGTESVTGFYIYGEVCGNKGWGLGPDSEITLLPEEERTYAWSAWECSAGDQQAYFKIDSEKAIDELNENNNEFTKTFYVGDTVTPPPVPVEKDILLVVDDESPARDVVLLTDLSIWLIENKDFEMPTAELNSAIKKADTHELVTVFIYNKKFLIIVGKDSPASDTALANDIKQHLAGIEEVSVCPIIKSNELKSDDLKASLCEEQEPEPMTPENPYYSAGTDFDGASCGYEVKCSGGWWKESCDKKFVGNYYCRAGDACFDDGEPADSYCTGVVQWWGMYLNCGVGGQRRGLCKDATAPQISNIQKDVRVTKATVTWSTNEPARSYVVELKEEDTGTIQTFNLPVQYFTEHNTVLTNLEPETTYLFKIKAQDAAENSRQITNGFVTLKEGEEPVEEEEEICYTTDHGKNYYVKGVAWSTYHVDANGNIYESSYMGEHDECCNKCDFTEKINEGIYLREGYCDKEGVVRFEQYECPNGCKDGACVFEKDECVDTDPDKDYYTQGCLSYGTFGICDMCGLRATEPSDSGGLKLTEVYQCKDESNCVLFEAYCLASGETGGFTSEDYKCPNGCMEGACIPEENVPNLIITDLEFEPANPKPGDKVTVAATVENIGDETAIIPARSKFIGLFLNQQYQGAVSFNYEDELPDANHGPHVRKYHFDTTITGTKAGTYDVMAKVNFDRSIKESNYRDNTYTEELEFRKECLPDLEITKDDIMTSKNYVLIGDTVDLKIRAHNRACATKYDPQYDSVTLWLFYTEEVRLPNDGDFTIIKLWNVGSDTTNKPVVIEVDDVIETVTGTETVNGVEITVVETFYEDDVNKRSALLEIKLPNWHIASIGGKSIVSISHIEPLVSYPEKDAFGRYTITKDEPIPAYGTSYFTKKWMFPSIDADYDLTIKADPDNIIKESDENNNEAKIMIPVVTKEVDCNADFTLKQDERAVIKGRGTNAIKLNSVSSSSVSVIMFTDVTGNIPDKETKTISTGGSASFRDGKYTLQLKSISSSTATLRFTKCPSATALGGIQSRLPSLSGFGAGLLTGLSWFQFF